MFITCQVIHFIRAIFRLQVKLPALQGRACLTPALKGRIYQEAGRSTVCHA
jgi:hypothetical protein